MLLANLIAQIAFGLIAATLASGVMAQGTQPLMFGGKGVIQKPHGSDNDAGFGIDPSAGLFASTWGEPSAGLELAEIVYRERPQNIKAAHAYAWALHRVGRSNEALLPLEQALRFDTTDPDLSEHAEQIIAANR